MSLEKDWSVITVRLPKTLKAAIKKAAHVHRQELSGWVRQALEERVK